jgi:hypothetical protein
LYPYFQMILCFYFFTIFYKIIGVWNVTPLHI